MQLRLQLLLRALLLVVVERKQRYDPLEVASCVVFFDTFCTLTQQILSAETKIGS